MNLKRPPKYSNTTENRYIGGKPLLSQEIKNLGRSVLYTLSKGNQCFPTFCPDVPRLDSTKDNIPGSASYQFKLRISPSSASIYREWNFSFSTVSGSYATIQVDNEYISSASFAGGTRNIKYTEFVPQSRLTTNLSGTRETIVKLTVSGSVGGAGGDPANKFGITPIAFQCHEITRPAFVTASARMEGGIDLDTLNPEQVIFGGGSLSSDNIQYSSVHGIANNENLCVRQRKKINLGTWCQTYQSSSVNYSGYRLSGSSFETICKFTSIASPRYRNEFTGLMKVFLLGGISGSANTVFQFVVTTIFGDTLFTLTDSIADHLDISSWKVFDVPIVRQNFSTSIGWGSTGFTTEEDNIIEIKARRISGIGIFIPFTIQIMDPII